MNLASPPVVAAAALLGATFGGAVLLLIAGVRGTPIEPSRPPGRIRAWVGQQRSPMLLLRLGGGLLVGVLVIAVTSWPVAALGLAGLFVAWPALAGGARTEQLQIARLEALTTWTEALRDTTAARAGLEQAIPATAQHAHPLIRPALLQLVGRLHTRVPLADALISLAEELDHAGDMIIAALINNVQRRGDGLVDVLSALAVACREDLDLRRKISAGRAGDRRAVQLMLGIVIGVATFLVLFGNGSYTRPYATVTGQLVLLVVLGLFATAFIWLRSLAGGRAPSRFLPNADAPLDADELRIVAMLTATTPVPAAATPVEVVGS